MVFGGWEGGDWGGRGDGMEVTLLLQMERGEC